MANVEVRMSDELREREKRLLLITKRGFYKRVLDLSVSLAWNDSYVRVATDTNRNLPDDMREK